MNEKSRLIFVGGPPRSGTTLVQNILDSHPEILGGPEFLHLPGMVKLRKEIHKSIMQNHIDIICTRSEVDSWITSFVTNIFLRLADQNECKLYSEKTPHNVLVLSELMELFPEAYFIQVVRDPRAIVSSLQQVGKRAKEKKVHQPNFTLNVSSSISFVKQCFDAGFSVARKGDSKILTIVYENLIKNPEQETKKICKYLGLEWNESMLFPGEKKHLGEKAITSNSGEIWYNDQMYNRNIDEGEVQKWKKNLTLSQQIMVTLAFEDYQELITCGYDFTMNSMAQSKPIRLKLIYFFIRFGKILYRKTSRVVRSFPGISIVRKILASAYRFLQ
ncbi:sulfotransferase family protein [Desulfocastanea catecholica]